MKFNIDGLTIEHNDNNIAEEIRQEGTWYEHWLLDAIKTMFPHKTGVWVDIGANCGNHSLYFATHCNPSSVVAFEPHPKTFRLLKENVERNNLTDKIIPVRCAIGAIEGMCEMVDVDSSRLGSSGTRQGVGDIPVHKLDDLIMGQTIDLIKIDVEGGEVQVLQGAWGIVTANLPELFIETWDNLELLTDMLSPLGYELKERYCHAPVYHFSTNAHIPVKYTA